MEYRIAIETDLVGTLVLTSDGALLTGCRFAGDSCEGLGTARDVEPPVLSHARSWIARYLVGEMPDPRELPFAAPSTRFQGLVREAMLEIPYGHTSTYGAIARWIEERTGRRASARAVGGAAGRNPIAIIVPCHRVVGADGSLTGFGGGIQTKVRLLAHEGIGL